MEFRFTLNHQRVAVNLDRAQPLAEVLRDRFGLFATKVGCAEGRCGTCTVLVDGTPHYSCLLTPAKVEGHAVTTLEGLQGDPLFERVAESFVQAGAIQCGFCTSGLLVAVHALLRVNPSPSTEQVRHTLAGHLCRCAGYRKILEAVSAAAGGHQQGKPRPTGHRYVGRSVPRADAREKVRGVARYGADLALPGMLWAAFARSPHPHAVLKRVDVSGALRIGGVHAALTGADLPAEKLIGQVIKDTPVICFDKVRYIGDPIAVVAAESADVAREAASTVQAEYEVLSGVFSIEEALQPSAPTVQVAGNVQAERRVVKGQVDEALTSASIVLEHVYRTQLMEHAYLEPEAGIAYLDEQGRLTLVSSVQYPHYVREELARVTGLPLERIRVLQTYIGGAFGGKVDISVSCAISLLALKTNRPVKMVYSREESILNSVKRHPFEIRHRIGAEPDGRIVAMDVEALADTGAYAAAGPIVLGRVSVHGAGAYQIPNVRYVARAVNTNTVMRGAMRGFGVPQALFATECQIDRLARQLGIDPLDLRERNILREGAKTHTGQQLFDVGLAACLTAVRRVYEARRKEHATLSLPPGRCRGLGVAVMHYGLGYSGIPNPATATISVDRSGVITLRIGLGDLGQGSNTAILQMAAESLGVDLDAIHLITHDTDETVPSGPTSASRVTYFAGNAIQLAAREFLPRFLQHVAAEYKVEPTDRLRLEAGSVWDGTHRIASFAEACEQALPPQGVMVEGKFDPVTFMDANGQGVPYVVYSYAAHLAEVEVDTSLGTVDVLQIWAAHDAGTIVNPTLAEGQIEGGAVMGVGYALLEQLLGKDGRIENPSLGRYLIPTFADAPAITPIFVDNRERTGPFGAKGLAEPSVIPVAPAIVNAVYDATGVALDRLPIHPEDVLAGLDAIRAARPVERVASLT